MREVNLVIHSLHHRAHTVTQVESRPLNVSPGQIFHGRILKLYPNHLATLSINGMKVTAHLETALTVGERYWFEVQEGTGIPRLRVLDQFGGRKSIEVNSPMEELIEQLALPKTKKIDLFLRQLIEQQVPFSRQSVLEGSLLLERLNGFSKRGIDTFIQMLQRGLPLTKEIFLALQSLSDEPSLTNMLQRLATQLQQAPNPTTAELSALIMKILQGQPGLKSSPLAHLLLAYSQLDEASEEGQAARQLLIRLGVLQEGVTKTEWQETFKSTMLQPKNAEQLMRLVSPLHFADLASQHARPFFETIVSQLSISSKQGVEQWQQLLPALQTNEQANVLERLSRLQNESLSIAERTVLQQALGQGESTQTGSHLRALLTMLGYQHEHDVSRFLQGELAKEQLFTDRLKALLLQAQQQDLPTGIKEQINQTVLRLTGQQLLSQEQAGFHQFIMQVPLTFGSFHTEMTIQWEGKKKTDNELDPDYCRILFYLTLERLDQVIVDVQIQNRIITISIFNKEEKPTALIDLFLPILKQKLTVHNYQLLSLKWEKIEEVERTAQHAKNPYLQTVSYEGVDVRI